MSCVVKFTLPGGLTAAMSSQKMGGKLWTATLYSHIFAIEHNRRRMGPQPGPQH
jgi:hypothetical protein